MGGAGNCPVLCNLGRSYARAKAFDSRREIGFGALVCNSFESRPRSKSGSGLFFSILCKGRLAMFTFLLGPFLAALPKRWRQSLPFFKSMNWRIPSVLSGFGELLFGFAAMLFWYSYSVTTWVSRGLDV